LQRGISFLSLLEATSFPIVATSSSFERKRTTKHNVMVIRNLASLSDMLCGARHNSIVRFAGAKKKVQRRCTILDASKSKMLGRSGVVKA
jgi:tRNA A37 threonylcarbamoyladenosine synthetase subunit TsaC/SUA5/YrdC